MARTGMLDSIDFRPDAIPGDAARARACRVDVEEGWNRARAEALWPCAGTASVFNHPAWWDAAIESYGAGRRIFGVTVHVDAEVCGYWPFWEKRMGAKDGFARVVEPVGARLTDYVMPLVMRGHDRSRVISAMLGALKRELSPGAILLWPKADLVHAADAAVAQAYSSGRYLRHRHIRRCPRATLPHSFDAIAARWSGNRRKHFRRNQRQLSSLGNLTFDVAQTRGEMVEYVDTLFSVHRANWNVRGVSSEFDQPENRRFVEAIVRGLPLELLHCSELRLDGRAVSCNLDFRLDDELLLYKCTFDIAFARYSPGMVHMAKVLEWAIANGVKVMDFMQGEEDYKYLWADGVRETVSHAISPVAGLPVWLWNTKLRKMVVEYKV